MTVEKKNQEITSAENLPIHQDVLAIEAAARGAAAVAKASLDILTSSTLSMRAAAVDLSSSAQESEKIRGILQSIKRSLSAGVSTETLEHDLDDALKQSHMAVQRDSLRATKAMDRVNFATKAVHAVEKSVSAASKSADLAIQRAQRLEKSQKAASLTIAEANSASQVKSLFIANLSHEIRTPLTVIKGFAEQLLSSQEEAIDHRKWLESIVIASHQLELLINDMLDISKIEADKLDINLQPISLRKLIEEVELYQGDLAKKKNLDLSFRFEGFLPAQICTDATRFKQILSNVIGNAIKFTDQGQIQVAIRMQGSNAGEGACLKIHVSDDGIGITQEQERQLFRNFSQGDASISRRFGGTGLGLSLSRRLARLLGGDIVYSKGQGKGSTFTITIDPGLAKIPNESREEQERTSPSKTEAATQGLKSKLRVLIVEDAPDIAALLEHVLAARGCCVNKASSGLDGIQAIHAQEYDLVLMDIQMPGMDGYEATRQVRLEGFNMPIFALTAHAMKGERERCQSAGFNTFLTKPINFSQLWDAIQLHVAPALHQSR